MRYFLCNCHLSVLQNWDFIVFNVPVPCLPNVADCLMPYLIFVNRISC